MKASKIIRRHIMVELVSLLILTFSVFYASFAIGKSSKAQVRSVDGMVTVLDDSKADKLSILSDGAGLDSHGTTYTITNNNKEDKEYKIVIFPNVHNDKVLSQIKVAVDDIYIYKLTDLDRSNGGYVLRVYNLKPGYTKNHVIKTWYTLNTDESLVKNVKFNYKIETT